MGLPWLNMLLLLLLLLLLLNKNSRKQEKRERKVNIEHTTEYQKSCGPTLYLFLSVFCWLHDIVNFYCGMFEDKPCILTVCY